LQRIGIPVITDLLYFGGLYAELGTAAFRDLGEDVGENVGRNESKVTRVK